MICTDAGNFATARHISSLRLEGFLGLLDLITRLVDLALSRVVRVIVVPFIVPLFHDLYHVLVLQYMRQTTPLRGVLDRCSPHHCVVEAFHLECGMTAA